MAETIEHKAVDMIATALSVDSTGVVGHVYGIFNY